MFEAVLSLGSATDILRIDQEAEGRFVTRGANESPPGRAVRPLRCPNEAESGEVCELVAEGGIAERGLILQECGKDDSASGRVGPTKGSGEPPGEADLDDRGQFRHRPQIGQLCDS